MVDRSGDPESAASDNSSTPHGTPTPWSPASDQVVLYRSARLVDCTEGAVRAGVTVVVRGATIDAVMPDDEVADELLDRECCVDLSGRFLLPGLIDTHQHLATPPHRERAEALLQRQVCGGVTAIRVMADDLRQLGDLARAAMVGEIPAPDIFYAALMAGPGFFDDPRTWLVSQGLEPGGLPWMKAVDGASDIAADVTLARGTSAAAIKIYADLEPDLVEKITAEAHRQGLQAWAHATVFPTRPSQVVAAGVDVVSHAQLLGYELAPEGALVSYAADRPAIPDVSAGVPAPAMAGLFAAMHERGTILDATASMWTSVETASSPTREANRRAAVTLTAQAHHAGVDISTGTDYETPLEDPFPALHREMRFLAEEAGMDGVEVLRSATLVGARALGLQDVMGAIEPGKLANLVVLTADPTGDVRNISRIDFVVKRGRRMSGRRHRGTEPAGSSSGSTGRARTHVS